MANSINTNYGANVALQSLNATSRALATTQNRVSTGQAVSSAKDNGAIFAIATNQRAELGSLTSVKQSLQRGQSIVDVALAAGDTVISALTEMKSLAVAIEAGGSTATTTALQADYDALQTEIDNALAGANFDGENLWTASVDVISDTSGTTYTVGMAAPADATPAGATAAEVQTAIEAFTADLATLGTQSKSLERQTTFTSKMEDALEAGVGNLVDADLAKESARLTALQTKQQLGVQALSIANSSSSILLGLFR
ncbi:MAG: flagellin [Brevundimonas sp.]|uniref:Flagellin n=1 Tax=Brevundimonas albigilva TaxID=1312364 RepID=A0ABY4SNQ7_9CAUL|nr:MULTISPECIES: flagellin [Brevundimonas]MCV0414777.1 flagellin [Brevundimonas sp.]PZU56647.1 MAG: flagellin [Brevundimonas sp.]UQV19214.1 flagellin [Brevundimonas albigilva]URI15883.1 flagellin [Brevundimonas albigilva]